MDGLGRGGCYEVNFGGGGTENKTDIVQGGKLPDLQLATRELLAECGEQQLFGQHFVEVVAEAALAAEKSFTRQDASVHGEAGAPCLISARTSVRHHHQLQVIYCPAITPPYDGNLSLHWVAFPTLSDPASLRTFHFFADCYFLSRTRAH